jgi:tetratricopeptide (TPR) repeat protein
MVYYGSSYDCSFGYGSCGSDVAYVESEPVVIEKHIYVHDGVEEVIEDEGQAPVQGPAALPPEEDEALQPAAEEEPEEALPDPPGKADFQAGVEAFQAGHFEQALEHFRTGAEADETNGEAWMAVAQAAFATGDYAQAAEGLAKAGELGGFPRGYRFDPRPVYPDAKDFEKAVARLDKHLTKHADDADAHLVRAYIHVALGEKTEARQEIERVLELQPADETAPLLNEALLPALPPQREEDAPAIRTPKGVQPPAPTK